MAVTSVARWEHTLLASESRPPQVVPRVNTSKTLMAAEWMHMNVATCPEDQSVPCLPSDEPEASMDADVILSPGAAFAIGSPPAMLACGTESYGMCSCTVCIRPGKGEGGSGRGCQASDVTWGGPGEVREQWVWGGWGKWMKGGKVHPVENSVDKILTGVTGTEEGQGKMSQGGERAERDLFQKALDSDSDVEGEEGGQAGSEAREVEDSEGGEAEEWGWKTDSWRAMEAAVAAGENGLKGLGIGASEREESGRWEWRFEVEASLGSGDSYCGSSDVIGTVDFDLAGEFFATGGIARKVRIYSMAAVLDWSAELRLERERRERRKWGSRMLDGEREVGDGEEERDLDRSDEEDWLDEEDDELIERRRNERKQASRKRKMDNLSSIGRPGTPLIEREAAAQATICTPAKLSSVKWVPGGSSRIACGDYDGVVAEWDLEKGLTVCERDEHSGQRVWSIDYAQRTNMCASASDDGTVRLWGANMEQSAAVLKTPSARAVCCAEFNPAADHLLAIASAERGGVHLYDLRQMSEPIESYFGHSRTASYVRFMGPSLLVSASIDSTIQLWDVTSSMRRPVSDVRKGPATGGRHPVPSAVVGGGGGGKGDTNGNMTPEGRGGGGGEDQNKPVAILKEHHNVRNFVGLAVKGSSAGGLVACGSETNEVVVYEYSKQADSGKHILSLPFSASGSQAPARANQRGPFVSAVCWRQEPEDCTLVAANSEGLVRVIVGKQEVV